MDDYQAEVVEAQTALDQAHQAAKAAGDRLTEAIIIANAAGHSVGSLARLTGRDRTTYQHRLKER